MSGKTQSEKEEFIRGLMGKKPQKTDYLYALIAGYVGGKIAERTGKNK